MQEVTFAELRNRAKDRLDVVEGGDTVHIFCNGKPVAEVLPIRSAFLRGKDKLHRQRSKACR